MDNGSIHDLAGNPLVAQNPSAAFQAAQSSVVASTSFVAVGDFNGDGKADLAVTYQSSTNVGVLLGYGNGTFAPVVNYNTGGSYNISSVALGDFNGDGKLDLAVTNDHTNTVAVLLGYGNGTFATAVTYSTGGISPSWVAVGDFNGDGKTDLAVANYNSDTVGVLLGYGNGTFANAVTYSTGGVASSVAVGDFNGDGKTDLAVANRGPATVSVLLGNGNGTFAPALSFSAAGDPSYPRSLAVGDFNGDGNTDLAVDYYSFSNSTLGVLLGNGNGTFATTVNYSTGGTNPSSVTLGDFNGDGKLDLAVANGSNTVGVLLGYGNGTFANPVTYSTGGSFPYAVAVGDFNGDGKLDLAVGYISSVGVLLNSGNSNFTGQVYTLYQVGAFRAVHQPHRSVGPEHQRRQRQLHGNLQRGRHRCRSHRLYAGSDRGDGHDAGGGEPGLGAGGRLQRDGQRHHGQWHAGPEPGGRRQHPRPGRQPPGRADPSVAFQAAQGSAAGYASSVAVGDFNGDGKPDLAFTNSPS